MYLTKILSVDNETAFVVYEYKNKKTPGYMLEVMDVASGSTSCPIFYGDLADANKAAAEYAAKDYT